MDGQDSADHAVSEPLEAQERRETQRHQKHRSSLLGGRGVAGDNLTGAQIDIGADLEDTRRAANNHLADYIRFRPSKHRAASGYAI